MLNVKQLHPAVWLVLSALVLVLDYITKIWADSTFSYGQSVPVFSWLNWTLAYNTGAAFSFLADAGGWQRWFFVGLAIVVSIGLLIWLWRLPKGSLWLPIAICLLLGGALGNLYDRMLQGYVVDFIHVYWQNWHFPAFNIADMGISVGAFMLIIDSFFLEAKRERLS